MKKQQFNQIKGGTSGVTLVALVVTVVILIILSSITLRILIKNGIMSGATQQEEMYENKTATEQKKIDRLVNEYKQATTVAERQPEGNEQKEETPTSPIEEELVPKTENCIGYYADLDGDKHADGIIYADLAIGQETEAKWNGNSDSVFQYSKVTNSLKEYTKEEEEGSGFGSYTAPMLKEVNSGGITDRFYVMALNDFDTSKHYWYYNAYRTGRDKLKDTGKVVTGATNDFGEGEINTNFWIGTYNDADSQEKYGQPNANDLWKVIQGNLDANGKTWFVPSKSEWSAFGNMCYTNEKIMMTTGNYWDFGLNNYYWTSSQEVTNLAWFTRIDNGYISGVNVINSYYVRLSTTF